MKAMKTVNVYYAIRCKPRRSIFFPAIGSEFAYGINVKNTEQSMFSSTDRRKKLFMVA
ncbi:hypothetical protein ACE3MS_31330 [Paenibacillus dendritiformis]|uniref:hypothetical protein n=1 Tax=Paenibacillus dendritiformis TaxID=130049 RepID=UPI00364DCB54